jgi:hypothetical protein
MKAFLVQHKLTLIGAIIGAVGGYAYYHFIGCSSGNCAITSQPMNSTLYGTLMGSMFFSAFTQQKTIKKETNES